ncbi:hypothetical protein, partial [Thermus albus]|uniref:hypothetical protein n=1 Tax=Thermus albus TaxID=2908146 RepID=UPI001FAAA34C
SYRNGFVLQVEAGRIDHANHLNDPAATLWDVLAAHETLEHLRKDPFHTAPPRTKPGWGGILLEVEQPTRKLKGPGGLEDQSPWH